MTSLMKKEKKFEGFDECEQAFVKLKERLTMAPILTLSDPKFDIRLILMRQIRVWDVCLCKIVR